MRFEIFVSASAWIAKQTGAGHNTAVLLLLTPAKENKRITVLVHKILNGKYSYKKCQQIHMK